MNRCSAITSLVVMGVLWGGCASVEESSSAAATMGLTAEPTLQTGTSGDASATASGAVSDSNSGVSTTGGSGQSADGLTSGATSSNPAIFDVAVDIDVGAMSGGDCLTCSIILETMQSGTLEAVGATDFLGTVELQAQIMYALHTIDGGRVIFSADSNILYGEGGDCPLWEWLGASGRTLPRVLTVGATTCTDVSDQHALPPAFVDHVYSAGTLPAQYIGNPAALRADWDVVVYCEAPSGEGPNLPANQVQTLVDFVRAEQGGLYLISEFLGYLAATDIDAVNQIANGLGANFLATSLNWENTAGEIDFSCFPSPEG